MFVSGYIGSRVGDWHNRIEGDDYGRLLQDYQDGEIDYIHIGPHRTGATFLQSRILPHYCKDRKIFSDDVISGRLFDNGWDNVATVYKLVPNAKIIAVLRNQRSIINSAFRTYIKQGGIWTFTRYAEEVIKHRKYDYEALLTRYFDLYGRANCLVLLFEDLVRDPEAFLNVLLDFLNVDSRVRHDLDPVKQGPSNIYNEVIRWVNISLRITCGASGRLGRRPSEPIPSTVAEEFRRSCLRYGISLDAFVIRKVFKKKYLREQFRFQRYEQQIAQAYEDSNRKLEDLLQRDLREVGYR